MTRNEAIESLRLLYSATTAENKAALECLIPELKESEDERIREQIEQALIEHDWSVTYKVGKDDCLAWLEKQKEGNLVDKKYVQEAFYKGMQAGMRQKPAEWSEEDEQMRLTCIDIIEHFPTPSGTVYGPWGDCINWLNSLRNRPKSSDNWKPSEEQMAALQCAIAFMEIRKASDYDISPLKSLYDDLKKLK